MTNNSLYHIHSIGRHPPNKWTFKIVAIVTYWLRIRIGGTAGDMLHLEEV